MFLLKQDFDVVRKCYSSKFVHTVHIWEQKPFICCGCDLITICLDLKGTKSLRLVLRDKDDGAENVGELKTLQC